MPYPSADFRRVSVGVLEGDVDIGFSLVDMAEAERRIEDFAAALKALQEAENVYSGVQMGMKGLSVDQQAHLEISVDQLRRAIEAARQRANAKAES